MDFKKMYGPDSELIWKDRRRRLGLPLSFTRYRLIKNDKRNWCKLFAQIGFLFTHIEEINLYRIKDVSMHQSLGDKIFGTGTITIYSNDAAVPVIRLLHVCEPYKVRNMISGMVEEQRALHGVKYTEFQTR